MSLENDDHLARRALAESLRQTARERAASQYSRARNAELTLYREKVQAAKERVAAAEQVVEHIPDDFTPPGDPKSTVQQGYVAALAELDDARAALEAFNGGAPDGRDIAEQFQRAVDQADAEYNRLLSLGFPA